MKTVPIEPTEDMLDAADDPFHEEWKNQRAINRARGKDANESFASEPFSKAIYAAMVGAAPDCDVVVLAKELLAALEGCLGCSTSGQPLIAQAIGGTPEAIRLDTAARALSSVVNGDIPSTALVREVAYMLEASKRWRSPHLAQVEGPNDLRIYGGTIADDIDRWADLLMASVLKRKPKSTGAEAVIRDGQIVISIDIDALPLIVLGSIGAGGIEGTYKVTDAEAFAQEVCMSLNNEKEDGTTPIHEMFDKAFKHAIDQGAEGIEQITEDEFEEEIERLRDDHEQE